MLLKKQTENELCFCRPALLTTNLSHMFLKPVSHENSLVLLSCASSADTFKHMQVTTEGSVDDLKHSSL